MAALVVGTDYDRRRPAVGFTGGTRLEGSYELDESTGLTSAYSMNMTMDTDMVMEMPQVEGQPAGASSMSISMSMETTVEGTLGKAE